MWFYVWMKLHTAGHGTWHPELPSKGPDDGTWICASSSHLLLGDTVLYLAHSGSSWCWMNATTKRTAEFLFWLIMKWSAWYSIPSWVSHLSLPHFQFPSLSLPWVRTSQIKYQHFNRCLRFCFLENPGQYNTLNRLNWKIQSSEHMKKKLIVYKII